MLWATITRGKVESMEQADADLLRGLLAERRLLALSLLVDGEPYVAQLPFAARPDYRALLVHASQLAKHTRGLADGVPFSALIQAPETGGEDPFQIPRLMLHGKVRILASGTAEYDDRRATYLEKLPTGRVTFSLGDFRLFELVVEKARLVAGFGRTANLTVGTLERIAMGGIASGGAEPAESTGESGKGEPS